MQTNKSEKAKSRVKAREKMKEKYPLLLSTNRNVVHHKDENPFNNAFENLQIMKAEDHSSHHQKGKPKAINLDRDNCTARITIAFTENEKRRLDKQARSDGRTVSGQIKWILRSYLAYKTNDIKK